jgi:hypothetical protein
MPNGLGFPIRRKDLIWSPGRGPRVSAMTEPDQHMILREWLGGEPGREPAPFG